LAAVRALAPEAVPRLVAPLADSADAADSPLPVDPLLALPDVEPAPEAAPPWAST